MALSIQEYAGDLFICLRGFCKGGLKFCFGYGQEGIVKKD
jgi:hypothetical protein